jgi:hypothetical protein
MLVHPDDIFRVTKRDAGRNLIAEDLADRVLTSDENEVGRTAFFSIQQSAPDYLVRGVVAAHGVDGDLH